MTLKDSIVLVLILLGFLFLAIGGERKERDRIVTQCRTLNSFEADGVVFKCKEKVNK